MPRVEAKSVGGVWRRKEDLLGSTELDKVVVMLIIVRPRGDILL